MLKRIRIISIALLLIIVLNSVGFTQTLNLNIVPADKTVAFLIEQNKSANELIEKQKNRIADLESELTVEKENSASLGKSYEAAQVEISSLKTSNEALARAVAINENTIALLQTDNARQKEKAKKATRDKYKAYAAVSAVILLKLLIP